MFTALLLSVMVSHQATVNAKSEWTLGPCISQAVSFEVVPPEGHKINKDAPWSLELDGVMVPLQLDFSKHTLSFTVDSRCGVRAGINKVKYKLTTFTCLEDGSECFREVVSGNL